jgi:hypothetical protein
MAKSLKDEWIYNRQKISHKYVVVGFLYIVFSK